MSPGEVLALLGAGVLAGILATAAVVLLWQRSRPRRHRRTWRDLDDDTSGDL